MEIKKIAVIGSGVMGSGIAAHIANSNTNVILLDMVLKDARSRNQLTEGALEKMKKADPAMLTSPKKFKYIEIGNLEDDLKKLKDCDWIIEVVLEDLAIKQNLYKKINEYRKPGSMISSNTSTIPLEKLTAGIGGDFEKDFLITHFFNPPRYMRLLEVVYGAKTRKDAVETVKNFCDVKLGKGVVVCKDSPGFIANRIGTFWLTRALNEAISSKTSIDVADAIMGKPIGVPKTGVFGLMDLIGLDLLPLIAKSFAATLPASDEFNKIFKMPEAMQKLISEGYTGRKGKGGFYKLDKDKSGKKEKFSVDLTTGNYLPSKKPRLASADAAKGGLSAMFAVQDEGTKYAWPVLRDTLVYTANLVGEIADEIKDIDEAMKLGYNWKYGPFELIDKFATKEKSGVAIFVERLKADNVKVPAILEKANGQPLYKVENGERKYFTLAGNYKAIPFNPEAWDLAEIKLKSKPILKNPSASLWDVGDGVVCFEFNSKMNSLDPLILELLDKSVDEVKKNYKAMIIGNDSENFTVGANIGVLLFAANVAAWKEIDGIIKQGQDAYMKLKYAPFPVVGAPAGMALGGGCEMLMHCDAVTAHVELYSGLVEVGVGLIPGWGGCKEFIYRQIKKRREDDSWAAKFGGWFSWIPAAKTWFNVMPPFGEAMVNISTAKVSRSAEEAKSMLILNDKSTITMNRSRLLADAKRKALELVPGYAPPVTYNINLPGKTARTAMDMRLKDMQKTNQVTPYDIPVTKACAWVLSGGETDILKEVTEQQMLDLEREEFVKLVKNKGTLDRIEHRLEKGKPLRN